MGRLAEGARIFYLGRCRSQRRRERSKCQLSWCPLSSLQSPSSVSATSSFFLTGARSGGGNGSVPRVLPVSLLAARRRDILSISEERHGSDRGIRGMHHQGPPRTRVDLKSLLLSGILYNSTAKDFWASFWLCARYEAAAEARERKMA